MPKKSRPFSHTDRFYTVTHLSEKELSKLPAKLAPLHVIASYCLKEAGGSDTWAAGAAALRTPDPHRPSSHDPELKRAEETAASAHESLAGIADKWRALAVRADQLAQDILDAKRSDLERVRSTEDAEHEAFHLAESHSTRIHPPKNSTKS